MGSHPVAVIQYTFTHTHTRIHTHTRTINRTTQNEQCIEKYKNFGRVLSVPSLCGVYPGICLKTEKKGRSNLSILCNESELSKQNGKFIFIGSCYKIYDERFLLKISFGMNQNYRNRMENIFSLAIAVTFMMIDIKVIKFMLFTFC